MIRIKGILRTWIPLAVAVTCMSGLVYLVAQQVIRAEVNDPQIEMAEDVASALSGGQSPEGVVPSGEVNIDSSLAPFVMVFDDSGSVRASSARLYNANPSVPAGVFQYVRSNGEDRITWQPDRGVRIAAVVTRFSGAASGFVLAGRNMREAERREDLALSLAVLGGTTTLLVTLLSVIALDLVLNSPKRVANAARLASAAAAGAAR